MIINYKNKEIQIKIVYYGCAMSGKTTSLKSLFCRFNRENMLTSIETTTGRTLFFDFGTLQLKGGDWSVKISLYTATGQDFYASTRPSTLSGLDGIMFVIDSQTQFIEDNLNSWNELKFYLANKFHEIPIIVCLNKRDLLKIVEIDDIVSMFDLNSKTNIKIQPTMALKGDGIFESFKKILNMIFPTIIVK